MTFGERVEVFHDYFAIRGGGERLALELANGLQARLTFGYRTDQSYGLEAFPPTHRDLRLGAVRKLGPAAPIGLAVGFARQQHAATRSDIRIFSGAFAPFAAPTDDGGVNILYCHTPPRFLYDQRDFYKRRSGIARKLGMAALGPWFRRGYKEAVGRMDLIVANSVNIQKRISTFLGRDSTVVYPPVDTAAFRWRGQEGYYLSTARMSPLKRIDVIIDAFRRMPEKRLIVTSGGDQELALRARAAGAPNITFTGWTSDEQLRELISRAIATIYVPIEEDFGMSPVESMAAGKPVIGVTEGGLLETIIHDQTGILLSSPLDSESLEGAVRTLTPERALAMRPACEAQAQRFNTSHFLDGMRRVIETAAEVRRAQLR